MKKLILLSSSLLLSWLSSSWMKWFTNKFTKYRHMGFVSYQIRLNKACWKTFKVRTTVVFAVQCYEYGIEIYNKKTDKDMYWNEVIFQLLLLFLHQNSTAQMKNRNRNKGELFEHPRKIGILHSDDNCYCGHTCCLKAMLVS